MRLLVVSGGPFMEAFRSDSEISRLLVELLAG
jgi:hypothetical protein